MQRRTLCLAGAAGLLGGCQATLAPAPLPDLVRQVTAAETAFAQTMADRSLAAFAVFIADDAIFINNGQPLRGKAAIVEHWKRFYVEAKAPFSWQPDAVEVLPSGGLAHSTGPVADPAGKVFARFYSAWRRDPGGAWLIVLDNGYRVCEPQRA
jgi:ketosteroid isomerase-like protein